MCVDYKVRAFIVKWLKLCRQPVAAGAGAEGEGGAVRKQASNKKAAGKLPAAFIW
jgi:hypothetical protein